MYEYIILMMSKKNQTRLLQRLSIASRLIQDCFNKQGLASRLTQDQVLPQNKSVFKTFKALVINYQAV